MILKEDADEKVKKGWLRSWLMFEALGISEEVTKKGLGELIKRLEDDKRAEVYKKEFSETKEIEKPSRHIEKGVSQMCEVEVIVKNLDNLVQIITEYGPSAIELLEPRELKINCGEAQAILNTISSIMHQFAAAGLGGIVFIRDKNE